MKKLMMIMAFIGFATFSKAQNAQVVSAYNYMKYNEYDKAKIAIDKAIEDPKTSVMPKTWFYRGQIYQAIFESKDSLVRSYDANAATKAYESYTKAIELDTKKQYTEDAKRRLVFVKNYFANTGITTYKEKDYAQAMIDFEKAVEIGEKGLGTLDTSLLYNAAISAQFSKNTPKTKQLLARLIDLKYPEPEIYRSLANVYLAEKDTTKALEYIGKGRTEYPTNNNLTIDELNIYMARGQSKQMIDKMEAATASDPTNKTLFFALGATYDNMNKKEDAEKAYLKAIELDPGYFDAYYNLGAMYYNQAVDVFNKTNDLPMSKQKEYDAGMARSKTLFNKALPHLEKALAIQPTDVNTLLSLKEIYAKTGDMTKSNEMKKRIEALKKK